MTPAFDPPEVDAAIAVIRSGRVTMGRHVQAFERWWADYVGVKHAIMVNSGSSANLVAIASLIVTGRIRPGQQMSTPATTWATTIAPLLQFGLTPRLHDIALPDYIWDPTGPLPAVGVHLLGNPIRPSATLLVGDCCEAHGAQWGQTNVGAIGLLTTFSFFASHHITALGEGGIVCTDDDALADVARSLRAHGWIRERSDREAIARRYDIDPRFLFVLAGYNLRPTEPQAAFALEQAQRLDAYVARRRALADELTTALTTRGLDALFILPRERPGTVHAWFAYPLTLRPETKRSRRELVGVLEAHGIETRPIMSGCIADHPMMSAAQYVADGELPNARLIHRYGLLVGCHQAMTTAHIRIIVNALERFARKETSSTGEEPR